MKVLYVIEAETGHDGEIGRGEADELAARLSHYQTWRDSGVRVWSVTAYETGSRGEIWLRHKIISTLGGYSGQNPATFSHRKRRQPKEPADTNNPGDAE